MSRSIALFPAQRAPFKEKVKPVYTTMEDSIGADNILEGASARGIPFHVTSGPPSSVSRGRPSR